MASTCPEYAFQVGISAVANSNPDLDCLRSFRELLESKGLTVAYKLPDGKHFIVIRDGSQATQADREYVRAWAMSAGMVDLVEIGPLVDLNELV